MAFLKVLYVFVSSKIGFFLKKLLRLIKGWRMQQMFWWQKLSKLMYVIWLVSLFHEPVKQTNDDTLIYQLL